MRSIIPDGSDGWLPTKEWAIHIIHEEYRHEIC